MSVVEERQLLVEEQGSFRRGRVCRDQIRTLTLPGKTMMLRKKKGILAAFIDFREAYDRVDGSKLWDRLEGAGLKGRLMNFLRAVYWGSKCDMKVGDMVSDSFGVVNGHRQGCVLSPVLFSLYIAKLIKFTATS